VGTLVIAVDPGKTSGVATWDGEKFDSMELDVSSFFDDVHTMIHQAVGRGDTVRLVSESFIITVHTAKNTQATWSLELIGVLKFFAHAYKLEPLVLQQPSTGKAFGTDAKLRHMGWYRKGMGHANDAARHLLTFMATRKMIPTETLVELASA